MKLNNLLYLLVKDSMIIFILLLKKLVLQSFWIFQQVCSLSTHSFSATPINWLNTWNDVNYVYNTIYYENQMSPKQLQKSILLYKIYLQYCIHT